MSVGDPWTLAHIQALFGDGLEALRTVVGARGRDDDAAHGAIAAVHPTTGLVQGPHTAVGWLALRDRLAHAPEGAHDALLAAAHQAKFGGVATAAVGAPPALPDGLAACLEREDRSVWVAAKRIRLNPMLDDLDGSRGRPGSAQSGASGPTSVVGQRHRSTAQSPLRPPCGSASRASRRHLAAHPCALKSLSSSSPYVSVWSRQP